MEDCLRLTPVMWRCSWRRFPQITVGAMQALIDLVRNLEKDPVKPFRGKKMVWFDSAFGSCWGWNLNWQPVSCVQLSRRFGRKLLNASIAVICTFLNSFL